MEQNKKGTTKDGCIGCLTIIVMLVAVVFIFKSCVFSGGDSSKDKEKDMTATIITVAQEAVNKNLKSPSSADYPWRATEYNIKESNSDKDGFTRYTISSYVDADNSFGAKIRTNYIVVADINPDDDSYYIISCNLNE